MKAKSVNNNLVGRKVVIDWPCRWRGAKPEFIEQLKTEAKTNHYFGEIGEIVGYNPAEENALSLTICLDSTKEIVHVHDSVVTITTVSPREEEHREIVSLLTQILEAVKTNSAHG